MTNNWMGVFREQTGQKSLVGHVPIELSVSGVHFSHI